MSYEVELLTIAWSLYDELVEHKMNKKSLSYYEKEIRKYEKLMYPKEKR